MQSQRLPPTDVAIVGGGPGGLALAAALTRRAPALRVKVFERAPGLQQRGAGVALHPNGSKALRAIDPEIAARVAATSLVECVVATLGPDGSELARQTLRFGAAKGPEQTMDALVPWHAMVAVLAESLPPGIVSYSKRFAGLQLEEGSGGGGGATLSFQDGSAVAARIVVGADGLLSPVRQAWLQDGGPEFDGRVILRGQARTADVQALPGWAGIDSLIVPCGNGAMGMLYMLHGGITVCAINVSYDMAKECGVEYTPYAKTSATRASLMQPEEAGAAVYADLLKLKDRLPHALQQVIAVADPATFTLHGDYVRHPDSYPDGVLGAGPVTLLGDAFHPLKVAGVGANLAFEDAAVLAHHLAQLGPCEAALRAYEADRLPRMKDIAGHIITTVNNAATTSGADYMALKKKQAEYERAVLHVFDHACCDAAAAAPAAAGAAAV